MPDTRITVNSVVQINENINKNGNRHGWVGALAVVTEVKGWGVEAFVPSLKDHSTMVQYPTRLSFDDIVYVGQATIPFSD